MKDMWCSSGAHDLCEDPEDCLCRCHRPDPEPLEITIEADASALESPEFKDAAKKLARHKAIVCEFCDKPVDPHRSGNFRMVQGWAQTRTGGGVHGLTDRKELNKYACGNCMRMKRMGVSPDQLGML